MQCINLLLQRDIGAISAVTCGPRRGTLLFNRTFFKDGGLSMQNRIDFEPVFFAPFVSSMMTIDRAWIDQSGHLDQAYCTVLFERALEEALPLLEPEPGAPEEEDAVFVATETHVRYVRDMPAGAPVRVTLRLIDYDHAHVHVYLGLHHGIRGWSCATSEQILSLMDPLHRRERPLPDRVLERVAGMKAAHRALPAPDDLGRRVEIFRRS